MNSKQPLHTEIDYQNQKLYPSRIGRNSRQVNQVRESLNFDDRPIYYSLPNAYSSLVSLVGLTDVAYVLDYWEKVYHLWNYRLSALLEQRNLESLSDDQLDFMAAYFGFSGDYYKQSWTKQQKICLFNSVYKYPYIWRSRGSQVVFYRVLDCLNLPGKLTRPSGFIAGIAKAGDVCGQPLSAEYLLYVPENITDQPQVYDDLIWVIHLFIPLHCKVTITKTNDPSLYTR